MNKERLIQTLQVQSESYNSFRMFAYIIRQLNEIGCEYYVHNGNIYATKGKQKYFPCVVSHIDTVHQIQTSFEVLEFNDKLTAFNRDTMTQTGIGGDDKVGVFICLESLRIHDNIKAAFFHDEEVGCVGSYEADCDFFDDCGFVLQCDRRGNSDFIIEACGVELSGKAFKKAVKNIVYRYGYDFEKGLMTDVMALKENYIDAAMANISCGYYNPHCDNEYVSINDVAWCLNLVTDIITTLNGKAFKSYYQPKLNWSMKATPKKDTAVNKPVSPFNADSRNYTTEVWQPETNTWKKIDNDDKFKRDWEYWENEFAKIKSKQKEDNDSHAYSMHCDSCRENVPTEYVPEFRSNICASCLLSYETYNSYKNDSNGVNFDS